MHVGITPMQVSSKKLFFQLQQVFWSVCKDTCIFCSRKLIVNTMFSHLSSFHRQFFISLKSNQMIVCPFQIKRSYLNVPWKSLGIFSTAEGVPWAIFLSWGDITGFIFPWCFCTISRPSRRTGQEYEVRNWILIFCVAVGHTITFDYVVLSPEKCSKLMRVGVCI